MTIPLERDMLTSAERTNRGSQRRTALRTQRSIAASRRTSWPRRRRCVQWADWRADCRRLPAAPVPGLSAFEDGSLDARMSPLAESDHRFRVMTEQATRADQAEQAA